jgi:thioredoxin 1
MSSDNNGSTHFLPFIFLVVTSVFFFLLFQYKDDLTQIASQNIRKEAGTGTGGANDQKVDSMFNYLRQGKTYQFTLLAFSSKGCHACRRMEPELVTLRESLTGKVNVVDLNIRHDEHIWLMKYYGIISIPTQVILNRFGEEISRHEGYISADDLMLFFR